jgi:hypothetical protein
MLETKNVFLDTQCYVRSNFNLSTPAFTAFRKACEIEELNFLSTSVVENEVLNRLSLSIKDSLSSLQTFRKKASILSTINNKHLSSLFNEVNEDDINIEATNVLHSFNTSCKYEYIKADLIDAEVLLTLYFNKNPPFGAGKKKVEFPDAISMLSIESHLSSEEKSYIVSGDKDLRDYCEHKPQLIYIESLDKLIDIYNQHNNVRTEKVKNHIISQSKSITSLIINYIDDCDVYNNSTWEDAEVESFQVHKVSNLEPKVINITNDECMLTMDVVAQISVEVVGPDFTNGTYDRESGQVYTFGSITREEILNIDLTVELNLNFEYENGELLNIDHVDIHIPDTFGGIEVDVEEHDDENWK